MAVLLAALVTSCGNDEPVTAPETTWELLWSDEFEGPAGQPPRSRNWQFDIGTDWGNAQLEYDTDRPENVSLDGNGNLAITARRESYQGRQYTSARINTNQRFSKKYGRFAARIKLPEGRGIWPAFWLLGGNFSSVGWPECGEIDILEYRGQEPRILHASVHGPGYSGGNAVTRSYTYPGSGLNDDFHVYAIEWDATTIRWYLDDTLIKTVTTGSLPGPWVFDQAFFIILNVAVGGRFVGPPDGSTVFPQTMLVDWVRVYRSG
jgi:beta-glucanase (GH16 family)